MEKYGIDGFKFDAGDPSFYLPSDISARPSDPNGHCEAWASVGLRYALNEYRACWKQAGKPLVQRLSDKNHSWGADGLASLIPNALAQGLMGYAYTCPDMIGGGQIADVVHPEFRSDQELFVRYAHCSALFPMMQFSTALWRVLDRRASGFLRRGRPAARGAWGDDHGAGPAGGVNGRADHPAYGLCLPGAGRNIE